MEISRVDVVKVVGIPGGISKMMEKRGFPEVLMQKVENSRGVIIEVSGNPGGQLQHNLKSAQVYIKLRLTSTRHGIPKMFFKPFQ